MDGVAESRFRLDYPFNADESEALNLRRLLSFFVPHGIIALRDRRRIARWTREQQVVHQERAAVIAAMKPGARARRFDYEEAIGFLIASGCDGTQVRAGSMELDSLLLCMRAIAAEGGGAPRVGLHVGNFVGVSLAAFAFAASEVHADSVVFAVDPNVVHRGITNPMQHVIALLDHFGLTRNAAILTGYSLEKSISNDGVVLAGYDPAAQFRTERSCEEQLRALAMLGDQRFDFALIDGNHHGEYFARELAAIDALLKPGGLLLLDDISWQWEELRASYNAFRQNRYEEVEANGRVAISRKRA